MHQPSFDRLLAPTVKLDLDVCRSCVTELLDSGVELTSLAKLRDRVVFDRCRASVDAVADSIRSSVEGNLEDPSCGIVAIDVPEGVGDNVNEDAKYGAIIAVCMFARFMTPTIDSLNQTPFTLYSASLDNERQLQNAGVKFFSPSEKLGFHTDGRLDGPSVYIPKFIALYNLLIAYRRPGDFYWIPFNLWDDRDRHAERIGWNIPYKFALTPIVYSNSEAISNKGPRIIEAPIFTKGVTGEMNVFMNGEVVGLSSGDDNAATASAAAMKDSISRNGRRYCIPQRTRRILIMKNTAGFHARDILEEPIENTKHTRSFIRTISMEGPKIY